MFWICPVQILQTNVYIVSGKRFTFHICQCSVSANVMYLLMYKNAYLLVYVL